MNTPDSSDDGVIWQGVSSAGQVLRVLQVMPYVGDPVHYALTVDHVPVHSAPEALSVIRYTRKEWAL